MGSISVHQTLSAMIIKKIMIVLILLVPWIITPAIAQKAKPVSPAPKMKNILIRFQNGDIQIKVPENKLQPAVPKDVQDVVRKILRVRQLPVGILTPYEELILVLALATIQNELKVDEFQALKSILEKYQKAGKPIPLT